MDDRDLGRSRAATALTRPGADRRRAARRPDAWLAAALLLACAMGAWARPAGADEPLVISPADLARQLGDPELVLLHVGDRADYDAGHISGARFVALADLSVSDRSATGLALEMPPADVLRQRLAGLGISDRSRVVVYYGKDWISPTTRVVFTLDYAGLGGRTSLLDGGQPAWVREGHSVTTDVPPAREGQLSPLRTRPIIVDAEFVRSRLGSPGIAIVDARTAGFYDGTDVGGPKDRPHRAGHIAGARSLPFTQTAGDDLRLRSLEDLRSLFSKAGVKPGDTVLAYCHIGQQATALIFAARRLGHPVLLYDGSFEDWSRRGDLPVETATAPDKP